MRDTADHSKPALPEKIAAELREYFILAGYLYVCFTALAYLKASILHAHGFEFSPWAFAAVKAAVSAKFMLLGSALHVGEGFKRHPLIVPTLYKSVAFFLLLALLTVIEEAVLGFIHGRTVSESLAEIGGGTFDQIVATSFIMLLIFIPYFAFRSLGDVIGDGTLVRLYFEPRQRPE